MPFKSKAQARYLFATHPKIAEEFAKKTSSIKKLPEKIRPKVSNKTKRKMGMK